MIAENGQVNEKNRSEYIELAKAYVALSNAHQLDRVFSMFVESAQYQSSTVGEYHGKSTIEAMMTSFFARYSDVYWIVSDYRYINKGLVEFDFFMTATDVESQGVIERKGLETIQFNTDGQINAIQVTVQS